MKLKVSYENLPELIRKKFEDVMKMQKTGLYFGSFNPIHIGHMVIANYLIEFSDLDQLWFVVSPQNPQKEKKTLLADYHRLELVMRAVEDDDRLDVSDIEFRLPRPSYTIDTLVYLEEKNPNKEFILIMGADGLKTFHKWKNAEILQEKYHRLVYPRPGTGKEVFMNQINYTLVDAPQMDISSSFIRKAISEGKDVRHFMPVASYKYLDEMNFYKSYPG